jgi:hypothetical protein
MANLLKLLPKVQHSGVTLSNLLNKVGVIQQHLDKYTVYYPYSVKDGERPDTIAHDYYGNSEYAWLVMVVNQIIDPYLQWPLDDRTLMKYIRQKYGMLWETKTLIAYYHYTGIGSDDPDIGYINHKLTEQSYLALPVEQQSGWTPVYVYEDEIEINDAKRQIKLISNQYLKQIDREIVELLN